jgi:hypothetical protein
MPAISIAIVSDTKQAVTSVKNLSTEYSGLVDQLKTLGPDGAQAADQLEQSMKAAQIATQDAATASKELVDSISKAKFAAAQGGLDMSKDLAKTAEAAPMAAGGVRQVSEEGSKLAEGLKMNASFGLPMLATQLGSGEGGVAGAATSAAGALSGMGMMMGPEVAVPAAALGAGMAWLASQLGAASDESAAFQASVGADVDEMIKLGPAAMSQAEQVNKSLQSMSDNTFKLADGTSKNYDDIVKDAESVGVSTTTMMQAYAGIPDAIGKVNVAADENRKKLQAQSEAQRQGNFAATEFTNAAEDHIGKINDVSRAIGGNTKAAKEAKSAYEQYQKAQDDAAKSDANMSKMLDTAKTANKDFAQSLQSDLKSTGSELDQILDRSKKDADTIISNQQKEVDANKRFLDDWNKAVKDGLDANGQAYVESNRASFQEVIDTYGPKSPQAKQYIANANTLGKQQSAAFTSNFEGAVVTALTNAQKYMNLHKLIPQFDVSGLPEAIQESVYNAVTQPIPVNFQPVGRSRLGLSIG